MSNDTDKNTETKWLSVRSLTKRWDCSQRTVRRVIWRGDLKAITLGEGMIRVSLAEVERYEKSRPAA
jgi:hypothetical protein